jgi:uncharacterized protein HemX
MYLRTLGLILLIATQLSYAQGRKPAVEDFVGIEIETPESTPQGTEGLFNFEKDISEYEKVKDQPAQFKAAPKNESGNSNTLTTTAAVLLILGLPALIWFMMMNHLRQKAQVQSASNIEVLDKYRKEKEANKKAQEDFKKVS